MDIPSDALKKKKHTSELIHFPSHIFWRCVRCGMCCGDTRFHRRQILLLENEATLISRVTGFKIDEFTCKVSTLKPYSREIRKMRGKCVFLQDHRCQIYHNRPLTCRFYPFGIREEEGRYTFYLTDEPCKGLGSGSELKENFFTDLLNYAKKTLKN